MKLFIILFALIGCSDPVVKYHEGQEIHIDYIKGNDVIRSLIFYECYSSGTAKEIIVFNGIFSKRIRYKIEFECLTSYRSFWTELK